MDTRTSPKSLGVSPLQLMMQTQGVLGIDLLNMMIEIN
jgi:hypothetical protein